MTSYRDAWQAALYGPDGFYRRERPAGHFRTSVHASELFGRAIARLAEAVGVWEVVDLGSGGGELGWVLRSCGLEVVEVELDDSLPDELPGLVVANEWLDNVPCEVVELDDAGVVRYLDPALEPGEVADGNDLAWLEQWWPLTEPGDRAEVGLSRDRAWAEVSRRLVGSGMAVAIDYGHTRESRPPYGTLTGFRSGRECEPVPDGSCDITAHVALDSLGGQLLSQRDALQALGVSARRPEQELARTEPLRYVAELSSAGEAAELLDASGLGGFGWVWTAVAEETVRRASRALSA